MLICSLVMSWWIGGARSEERGHRWVAIYLDIEVIWPTVLLLTADRCELPLTSQNTTNNSTTPNTLTKKHSITFKTFIYSLFTARLYTTAK